MNCRAGCLRGRALSVASRGFGARRATRLHGCTRLFKIMPAIPSGRRRRRILVWCLSLALLAIPAAYIARSKLCDPYHRWNAERHVRRAAEALAKDDPKRALLDARNALKHNGRDAEAVRIVAKSLEALGVPEAGEWRSRLDALLPRDPENVPALAGALLKSSGWQSAEQRLETLDEAGRNTAAFHAVAAAIALEKHDSTSAESHWAEAVRLEPGVKRHRLSLAAVRLESKAPGQREAALADLEKMRANPATGPDALRQLLADAIRRRETVNARALADALVAEKSCTFRDKLTRLTTLRLFEDARSTTYLIELRDAAISEPMDLCALLSWMNTNNLALLVEEWVQFLPPEMISRPPVGLAVAEALMRSGEWQKLDNLIGTVKWGEMEFMRKAFLTAALDHIDEEGEAAREWKDAIAAVRTRSDGLERLARFAVQAKWASRAEEIMRTLATMPQCPRWVMDSLWKDAFQRSDTTQLQKLSGAIAKSDPKGIAARNNYAFLSLLTRNAEGNPHRIAETLHREHPENALVTSTYALSLYQQGKAAEAAALMSTLKPEALREPQVALYQAIFLLSIGQAEKADEFLALSAKWQMLPEEKTLLERAKVAGAKAGGSAGDPQKSAPADRPR